jgi:hypothetical protein
MMSADGDMVFEERRFAPDGSSEGESRFSFEVAASAFDT